MYVCMKVLTETIGMSSGPLISISSCKGSGISWKHLRNIAPLAASFGVRPARPTLADSLAHDIVVIE